MANNKKAMISTFHYITQDVAGYTHQQLVELACKGGANWIQLRVKGKSYEDLLPIAKETKAICKKYHATFIINDNVQLAKEIEADGVHLGKEDMPVTEARKFLGKHFIIGGTANTFEDIKRLNAAGADYVGLGPYRFTTTKKILSPVLGLEGIRNIVQQCKAAGIHIPVIGIGGIKLEDMEMLMETGIHGVAVSSAINLAEDKAEVINRFLLLLNEHCNKPLNHIET